MNYKRAFFGLVLAVVLAWCASVEYRAWQPQAITSTPAMTWLFQNTDVTNENGQTLTRANLLDGIIQSAITNTAAAQPPPDDE